MARVAVIGPGSVGLFFAGHLAAAGHDVVACARRRFDRYVIESREAPLDLPAKVATDPSEIGAPAEWVLLCVKAHQTAGAASWFDAVCGLSTRVLVVQNGVEHDHADGYLNGAVSIPTVVYCGAELLAPGHIRHSSHGHLFVPEEPFGDELRTLFEGSKAGVRPTPDFVDQQWRKLSLNVVVNGLTALTGRTSAVFAHPRVRPIAVALLAECWTVAAAAGAQLDPADAESLIDRMIESGLDGGSSMLYDTRAGRPTEHDAIHGALLRKAAVYGIDTPTVRVIHGLLDAR